MLTPEQKMQIKMNLAIGRKDDNASVLEDIYNWVVKPEAANKIMPVQSFTEVKQ